MRCCGRPNPRIFTTPLVRIFLFLASFGVVDGMPLVDYASSSGEEEQEKEEEEEEWDKQDSLAQPQLPVRGGGGEQDADTDDSGPELHRNENREAPTNIQPAGIPSPSVPTISLPDASLLFDSPSFSSQQITGNDHTSTAAAAMSQCASRKREANGSALQFVHNKNPRVSIPHSRTAPARSSDLLPPQLLGRSNVVTEDISKLFVNRRGGR